VAVTLSARRPVAAADRPAGWLAVARWPLLVGTVAAVVFVAVEAPLSVGHGVVPLWNWWGLTDWFSSAASRAWASIVAVVAIGALVWAWLRVLHIVRDGRRSGRLLAAVTTAWGLPFVLGPPLLSLDVYAYVAQGRMVNVGLSPYQFGPAVLQNPALQSGRIVAAVDPLWRTTKTPYGPLLLAIQALAQRVAGPHPVLAVLLFRLLVLVALAVVGVLVWRMVPPAWRATAIVLVLVNPLTLVFLVGGVHLDALMTAAVVLGLFAWSRGRPLLALALATAAAEMKVPAAVLVAALLVADLAGRSGVRLVRRAATDLTVVGAVLAACSLVIPDGFGWVHALATPAKVAAGVAPAELIADVLHGGLRLVGVHAGVLTGVRIAFAVLGAATVGWLALTVRRRGVAATTVLALLVTVMAAPVLYVWYMFWALVPAAVLVDRAWARNTVLGFTGLGLLGTLPSVSRWPLFVRHVVLGALALIVVGVWAYHRYGNRLRAWRSRSDRAVRVRPTPAWPRMAAASAAVVSGLIVALSGGPPLPLPAPVQAAVLDTYTSMVEAFPYGQNAQYGQSAQYYVVVTQARTHTDLYAMVFTPDGTPIPPCANEANPSVSAVPTETLSPVTVYSDPGAMACYRLGAQALPASAKCPLQPVLEPGLAGGPTDQSTLPPNTCRLVPVWPWVPGYVLGRHEPLSAVDPHAGAP
jgi:alpha-1,6-mannosyltransferase